MEKKLLSSDITSVGKMRFTLSGLFFSPANLLPSLNAAFVNLLVCFLDLSPLGIVQL